MCISTENLITMLDEAGKALYPNLKQLQDLYQIPTIEKKVENAQILPAPHIPLSTPAAKPFSLVLSLYFDFINQYYLKGLLLAHEYKTMWQVLNQISKEPIDLDLFLDFDAKICNRLEPLAAKVMARRNAEAFFIKTYNHLCQQQMDGKKEVLHKKVELKTNPKIHSLVSLERRNILANNIEKERHAFAKEARSILQKDSTLPIALILEVVDCNLDVCKDADAPYLLNEDKLNIIHALTANLASEEATHSAKRQRIETPTAKPLAISPDPIYLQTTASSAFFTKASAIKALNEQPSRSVDETSKASPGNQ